METTQHQITGVYGHYDANQISIPVQAIADLSAGDYVQLRILSRKWQIDQVRQL
jgi:hypothetical protein